MSQAIPEPTEVSPLASPGTSVDGGDSSYNETSLRWQQPRKRVLFREWYMYHYCNNDTIEVLVSIQKNRLLNNGYARLYFRMWSLVADIQFIIAFVPLLIWAGYPHEAVKALSMLLLSQYTSSLGKDLASCPRPPCPPLKLHGNADLHCAEYGFPSSHASHSLTFSYFFYQFMIKHVFPESTFLCVIIPLIYFAHVLFSRIYLSMHWPMDMVAGCALGLFSVSFHAAFINHIEYAFLTNPPGLLGRGAIVFACLLLIWMLPLPIDRCVCVTDAVRFSGAYIGACFGFWTFKGTYGCLTARPEPHHMQEVVGTWWFWLQWLLCIVILVIFKEVFGFLSVYPLKIACKTWSGVYEQKVPRCMRPLYRRYVTWIGRLFRLNKIRLAEVEMADAIQSPFTLPGISDCGDVAISMPDPATLKESSDLSSTSDVFSESQQWSCRSFKYWWVWDLYSKLFAYLGLAFAASFIAPAFLWHFFGVHPVAAPQG